MYRSWPRTGLQTVRVLYVTHQTVLCSIVSGYWRHAQHSPETGDQLIKYFQQPGRVSCLVDVCVCVGLGSIIILFYTTQTVNQGKFIICPK